MPREMQTKDLDEEPGARPITVRRKGSRLIWTWPCGQEFDVSRAKFRNAVAALDAMPQGTRNLTHHLKATDLYTSGGVGWDVSFYPESKTRCRVYSEAEGDSALLPMKDLRAAADL